MAKPWRPPLPTIGRAGPKISVLPSSTLLQRLEEYYSEFRSVPDIFERRVSPSFQMRALRYRGEPRFLSDFEHGEQLSLLLRNLYFKVSAACRSKMKRTLKEGALHQVRAWFQTCDAVCLPLLICNEEYSHYIENECDVLTNWALENCAHNYAHFQSHLKGLKKQMRKSFAIHRDINHVDCPGHMIPYWRAAKYAFRQILADDHAAQGRLVLLWCQTRATGMANEQMISQSFEKFKATVTEPGNSVTLQPEILRKVCTGAIACTGTTAKVSVGTTACLESSRAAGGKTQYVSYLARHKVLRAEYDFRTLEETPITPRPIRSAKDLVNWAVYNILHNPTYTSCVRVHGVAEPSKARTITVAPYSYQVLMGVFAHIFQPSLQARQVRSGLKADRHLWRFLTEVLNPQNKDWETLIDGNVYALSTDLSEATDWGNRTVARQIWDALIRAAEHPEFPLGLAILAKTKYCGKRFAFLPDTTRQNYELVILQRGWLMGDMMTKTILTLAHQYCCELSGLTVYTLVGDDEIALDSNPKRLKKHIETLGEIFKVSEDDTFISGSFAFYCEEGTLVPQRVQDTPHVRMRRGLGLDYLDYPRIRLLLPQPIETDAYSMSNIGRFALLGKESRWVANSNPGALDYFSRASLLQHLLVPQEPDCISPYTPIEIGGDGAFPHTPRFMEIVINDKSRNPRETKYRLLALLNNRFSHKFVRSDRLDKVVNKHHLYLPKIEKLREILPPDAIIQPKTQQEKYLLQSLRLSNLKDPQNVFFDLAKGIYYWSLLQGMDPVEPVFNIDREYTGGHTHDPHVDYSMFIETWKNPGFNFQDHWGYMVDTTKIPRINPMNLGWDWSEYRRTNMSSRKIFEDWLAENADLLTQSLPDLMNTIREGRPLPPRVVNRLNLFLESDSYILSVLPKEYKDEEKVALISRDQKLSLLLKRKLDAWRPDINHTVYCVDPLIYVIGRIEESPLLKDVKTLEDPGAILHVDYTEFDNGEPHDWGIFERPLKVVQTKRGCTLIVISNEEE